MNAGKLNQNIYDSVNKWDTQCQVRILFYCTNIIQLKCLELSQREMLLYTVIYYLSNHTGIYSGDVTNLVLITTIVQYTTVTTVSYMYHRIL